ncbi:hypothetical protein [Rhizobium sp. HT1-10]|uniref:hypothetical protein n=1 Tax=Rhizobium sp. HT1-10 TaxID=3111638 RepID=UPI003C1651D8
MFETTWELSSDKFWGISGNTFRGFRKHKKPSDQYRAWAPQAYRYLAEIPEQRFDLAAIHEYLTNDLGGHWANGVKQISIAHRFKIVDLFLLHMCRCAQLGGVKRRLIVASANPPLDKFTLIGLATLVPGLVVGNLAMGAIEDIGQYKALQRVMEQITGQAGLPRLYFDVWCWPEKRRTDNGLPALSSRPAPILIRE